MRRYAPVKGVPPHYAEYLEEEHNLQKIMLLMTVGLLIFAPFILVLPLVILGIYRKDPKDFENPYRRRWMKNHLWKIMYLPLNFVAFYFLVFPLIPPNVPIWGLWSSLCVTRNMVVNVLAFAVSAVALILLTVRVVKPYFELIYHPYRDLTKTDDYLIIPTRQHGTLILKKINTGILVLGATGSGKTEFIKQLMAQFPEDDEYAFVIFDPNGDYFREFGDPKRDIVLSIKGRESTHAWNIFREIAPKDPFKRMDTYEDMVLKSVERRNRMLQEEMEKYLQQLNSVDVVGGKPVAGEAVRPILENLSVTVDTLMDSFPDVRNGVEEEEDPFVAISQIMGELFKDLTESSQDKFWNYSAQQVLEGIIYMMYKEALTTYQRVYAHWEEMHRKWEESGRKGEEPKPPNFYDFLPTNADLYRKVTQSSFKDIYEELNKHPELKMIASYLNPKTEKMAGSVWAVLGTQFKRIFTGTFGYRAHELKQISMKEYMMNPRGRKLFIEYDVREGEVTGAVYRVLIDRLIEYAFAKERKPYRKFFVIDEFHLVPKLNLYQALVNYGRQHNITSVIGVQAITQIITAYGKDVTNSIISGHRFIVSLSVTDEESKRVVEDRLGKIVTWERKPIQVSSESPRGGSTVIGGEYHRVEYTPLDIGNIQNWKPGECVIFTREGFKKTRLFTYKEALPKIQKVKEEIRRLRKKLWLREKNKKKGRIFAFYRKS